MNIQKPQPNTKVAPEKGNHELVSLCLQGDSLAWRSLVAKYQNLVYAIIRRSHAAEGDEDDLSQAVWIDIFKHLSQLRNPRSLRFWIATLTRHKCYHWGRKKAKEPIGTWDSNRASFLEDATQPVDERLEELERKQEIREVIHSLSPRCCELLLDLFLTDPPRPYAEVAAKLGLAVGSISYVRGTCLDRLRQAYRERGLQRS